MGRLRKELTQDVSAYTVLEQQHWSNFSGKSGSYYHPGKANVKPSIRMLGKDGYTQTFYDHERKEIQEVLYDKNYVMEHYYQKLPVTMGWVHSGTLEEDRLKAFLDSFFSYCKDAGDRARESLLIEKAKELALLFPGSTVAEWEISLREKVTEKKEPATVEPNGSGANRANKEKVATSVTSK